MNDPQDMFRAVVIPIGQTGNAMLQVRIGDLFQAQSFKPPSLLLSNDLSWSKGEMRQAVETCVLAMCQKIIAHGSIFKHREDCTLNVPAMAPCPKCQGPKLEVVE